jgi:hypothetical protein
VGQLIDALTVEIPRITMTGTEFVTMTGTEFGCPFPAEPGQNRLGGDARFMRFGTGFSLHSFHSSFFTFHSFLWAEAEPNGGAPGVMIR